MYFCLNEKAKSHRFTPFGIKKEKMREHLAEYQPNKGLKPQCCLFTKLAGKIFFTTISNYLVINTVLF